MQDNEIPHASSFGSSWRQPLGRLALSDYEDGYHPSARALMKELNTPSINRLHKTSQRIYPMELHDLPQKGTGAIGKHLVAILRHLSQQYLRNLRNLWISFLEA